MYNLNQAYSFSFPASIRFGVGVIRELPAHLRSQRLKEPLIVTDPTVAELGFFKKIVEMLKQEGFGVTVFSDISKNPVKSDVIKGGQAFNDAECDSIIGIGGGAALDVARAVALHAYHERDLFDYDDLIGGDKYVTEIIPYFVTVPTTSGTGSEVGRSAIISEDESKKKRILFSPRLMAKQIFADPELTYDLPPAITAATGMDALTHNMEAFLAKNFHPICEGIALEGMHLIAKSLEEAVNNPTPISRAKLMLGSMMGAIAFQKGLGVVHSLAHPLSALLDTHHGLANAVNIPYGMRFNYPGFETQFKRMARNLELADESGEGVVNWLFELNTKIGIPHKLSEIGVKEEHIETLADLAFADFCHPNNPKPVTREDFKKLYLEAL
ncbi:MAG: iron-containing alcohol dehydrogenase [Chitinophagales bacterium]|mgnify:CR=1 FL=1|nr:iron-containing alcohol dehydrogenase [Chitinophagales bacterium]